MPVKRRQNFQLKQIGEYYKEEWLEEFLDSKGAFYDGNENNEQQQLPESFANSCYKTTSPLFYEN